MWCVSAHHLQYQNIIKITFYQGEKMCREQLWNSADNVIISAVQLHAQCRQLMYLSIIIFLAGSTPPRKGKGKHFMAFSLWWSFSSFFLRSREVHRKKQYPHGGRGRKKRTHNLEKITMYYLMFWHIFQLFF